MKTDQKENQFFFLSEFNNTGNRLSIKLKVFPENNELCGKPEKLYKTNFEVLFVNYLGCFAMPGRELRTDEFSSNAYQFSIDNTSQVFCTSLSFSEVNGKWVGAKPWRSVGADEPNYELNLGTKMDFIMHFNTKQLRHSETTLLQNHCQHERTQMLTILITIMQNTRLAGYMLIRNMSMFLDTDGSVAWLYHCPKLLSPLRVRDKCYDRNPILIELTTKFVVAITHQTCDFASEIPCVAE